MRGEREFDEIYHPALHSSAQRNAVNYTECQLCRQPMLRDSGGGTICSRSMCRSVRMRLQSRHLS
jgi:hypothetical protein